MMSSDWQLEQTGVVRVAGAARRLKFFAGSWFALNGLRSEGCVMSFPLNCTRSRADPARDDSCHHGTYCTGDERVCTVALIAL